MRTLYYDKKTGGMYRWGLSRSISAIMQWFKQCRAIPWNFLSDQSDSYHTFWGVRNGLFNLHTIDLQEGRGGVWLTAWWWVEVMDLFSQRNIKQKHRLVVIKLSHFYHFYGAILLLRELKGEACFLQKWCLAFLLNSIFCSIKRHFLQFLDTFSSLDQHSLLIF